VAAARRRRRTRRPPRRAARRSPITRRPARSSPRRPRSPAPRSGAPAWAERAATGARVETTASTRVRVWIRSRSSSAASTPASISARTASWCGARRWRARPGTDRRPSGPAWATPSPEKLRRAPWMRSAAPGLLAIPSTLGLPWGAVASVSPPARATRIARATSCASAVRAAAAARPRRAGPTPTAVRACAAPRWTRGAAIPSSSSTARRIKTPASRPASASTMGSATRAAWSGRRACAPARPVVVAQRWGDRSSFTARSASRPRSAAPTGHGRST
jgi:hypothetical protein